MQRFKPQGTPVSGALGARRAHAVDEAVEQIIHIVRAGRCFGVTLEAESGLVGALQGLAACRQTG